MARAGWPLWLLLLSSFLASSLSVGSYPPSSSLTRTAEEDAPPKKINKAKEGAKAVGLFILSNIALTLRTSLPFLSMIEPNGKLISACVGLAQIPISLLDQKFNEKKLLSTIMGEFQGLNQKMDQYHVDNKWNIWAATTYSKPEADIDTAWNSFKTTVKAMLAAKSESEKQRHRDKFIDSYSKYESAASELCRQLNVRGVRFTNNLGDMLAEHVGCHEKDLRQYSLLVNKLIYKGNFMNHYYYRVKNIESPAREKESARFAYDAGAAMFNIQKECVLNSLNYVKLDVMTMINKVTKRSQLATDIWRFLVETYDRYDWIVVAFVTKKSSHKIMETRNKHNLDKFTVVTKGDVSVGVARQIKGTHTKATELRKYIRGCVPKTTVCYKVKEKLNHCLMNFPIDGNRQVPIQETYTAIHAYTKDPNVAHNTKEAPPDVYDAFAQPDQNSAQTPYIYTDSCEKSPGVKTGKYVVLIKSDEEIEGQNPCAKKTCGGTQRGKCIRQPDVFAAMCECNSPYYGENCERSMDDYVRKLELKSGISLVDSRRRSSNGG